MNESRQHQVRGCIKVVTSFGALVLLLVGQAACIDERVLIIVQGQVPSPGCEISSEIGEFYRDQGVLDVSGRSGYEFFPLVRNDLPSTVELDSQPERNNVLLRRYEVDLNLGDLTPAGAEPVQQFDVPISGFLAPGEIRGNSVTIVPTELVSLLQPPDGDGLSVVATVRAVADHNGKTLKSPAYEFPVRVCNGCLVTILPSCPGPDDTVQATGNFCGLPQDGPVFCCEDPSRGFICLRDTSEN